MKIVQINLSDRGSTGKIMFGIQKIIENLDKNFKVYCAFPQNNYKKSEFASLHNAILLQNNFLQKINGKLNYYTGYYGFFSIISTCRFIEKINRIKPNIIHLHNIHSGFINLPILFKYIKRNNIHLVWTLHDCWTFTGRCPHFQILHCEQWKSECDNCKYPCESYPQSKRHVERYLLNRKKQLFSEINDLVIVTPSKWLAELSGQSYLRKYPIEIIHNGIDLDVFKPTKSTFRENNGLIYKKVILGVCNQWSNKKGLDVFNELADNLSEEYHIVLVGGIGSQKLSKKILHIERTNNQKEIAAIYSAADVYVNPTREEVFGLVNIEALACGTPVITYKTGGSPEAIDENCGCVVECDDIETLTQMIIKVCDEKPFSTEYCVQHGQKFNMNITYEKYADLYERILSGDYGEEPGY